MSAGDQAGFRAAQAAKNEGAPVPRCPAVAPRCPTAACSGRGRVYMWVPALHHGPAIAAYRRPHAPAQLGGRLALMARPANALQIPGRIVAALRLRPDMIHSRCRCHPARRSAHLAQTAVAHQHLLAQCLQCGAVASRAMPRSSSPGFRRANARARNGQAAWPGCLGLQVLVLNLGRVARQRGQSCPLAHDEVAQLCREGFLILRVVVHKRLCWCVLD